MRIIIKGADFSANSIGKVGKDLSFAYNTDAELKTIPFLNIVDRTANLPWTGDTSNVRAELIYLGSSSATSFTTNTSAARIITDYIEVTEGMTITGVFNTTNSVPTIICFDESKNVLGPSATYTCWINGTDSFTFTIPSGVKYIKLEVNSVSTGFYFRGTMPE